MSELKEGESCSMSGPPLAKKPRSPAKGKGRLGDVRAQRRGRKTPAPGGKRPKRAGPLALGGLIVSIAAAWAAAAWRIGLQRSGKVKADRRLLNSALALPLRHISEGQVRAALRTGSVNQKKSDLKILPCPKLVVDAYVPEKNVQAVLSACPHRTDVVTVIDKDTNWECYCP